MVGEEAQNLFFNDGFNTGLNWSDAWENHTPGGPWVPSVGYKPHDPKWVEKCTSPIRKLPNNWKLPRKARIAPSSLFRCLRRLPNTQPTLPTLSTTATPLPGATTRKTVIGERLLISWPNRDYRGQ